MKKINIIVLTCSAYLAISCGTDIKKNKQINISNSLAIDRSFETVSVDIASLGLEKKKGVITIVETDTQATIPSQEIDSDGDGVMDAVLFQPKIKANSERLFDVVLKDSFLENDSVPACYSRFVPERTDDYAWENNKVAFRTYGPTAQKMVEDGIKGGTLSSGIDAWLKRVEYSVINSWYKKYTSGTGTYHEDTGEGLDNFHVGTSRGVGGTAKKVDSIYYFSKNFVSWKNLYNGPIRTSFVLTYANWDANGNLITEEKHISLDYGSNLSKFEITVKGTDTISAGLTLHDKQGTVTINDDNGWISYWEALDDSELGTGIVVPIKNYLGSDHYLTDKVDESNLFVHMKTQNTKAVYYAGFGWKKAGEFTRKENWESYLSKFAQCLKSPLTLKVK